MNNIFAIVGGDKRHTLLAEKLKEKGKVEIYALEKELSNTNTLENVIKNANIVISAIPFTRDNIYINTPLSDEKLEIKKFMKLTKDKIIFTGKEFLENEEFNLLNAELTAQAILSILISNLNISILNSNILILGYGRIGSILLKYIKALNGSIHCTYNNQKEKSLITINNGIPVFLKNLKDILKCNIKFDCIINTIPDIIFKEAELSSINNTVILDIASKPCIDINIVKNERVLNKMNVKYMQILGLPGKYFPKVSANIMKNIILQSI